MALGVPPGSNRYDSPMIRNTSPMRDTMPEIDFSNVEENKTRASPVPRD